MSNLERLKIIDEITDEICKIRGVDMPRVCVKIIVLTYIMYCANTYGIKYKNEDNYDIPINGGCIILCQKGTGKSRTLKALKDIFVKVEELRQKRYEHAKELKVGTIVKTSIPLTKEQQDLLEEFYQECGNNHVSIYEDTITAKALCDTYAKLKKMGLFNLLFMVDEAGDRLFRDAFSPNPSISSKEFLTGVNQLFDGYCGMGKSMTSKTEGIESVQNVGANFIIVSTAEFLKDFRIQSRFKSSFEAGMGRRMLYVNCPPIDQINASRVRYFPDFKRFIPIVNDILIDRDKKFRSIPVGKNLWKILETKGAGCGINITEEFLLLLFCTTLAYWTDDIEIKPEHWYYMVDVYNEIRQTSMQILEKDSTLYDRICVFMREYLELHPNKKVPVALIKDYCARNKYCFESNFGRWFASLCNDFSNANTSRYIIERNQLYAWLSDNYAFEDN